MGPKTHTHRHTRNSMKSKKIGKYNHVQGDGWETCDRMMANKIGQSNHVQVN
jgi:hypothetical protein